MSTINWKILCASLIKYDPRSQNWIFEYVFYSKKAVGSVAPRVVQQKLPNDIILQKVNVKKCKKAKVIQHWKVENQKEKKWRAWQW